MSNPSPPRFDANDEAVVEYKAVSPWAVAGLLFGLASAATLISPTLWFLPLAGVPLNAWAMTQIALRGPSLVGRKAAVCGLLMSTLFLVYVPAENYCYHLFLSGEARQVAAAWFQTIGRKDPAAAHRWMIDARLRGPSTARPDAYYKANPRAIADLKNFLEQPVVRTLFALGPAAQARYYETDGYGSGDAIETVTQTYAITFDPNQLGSDKSNGNKLESSAEQEKTGKQKTSFFVVLFMERSVTGEQTAQWRVSKVEGPVRPSGWGS